MNSLEDVKKDFFREELEKFLLSVPEKKEGDRGMVLYTGIKGMEAINEAISQESASQIEQREIDEFAQVLVSLVGLERVTQERANKLFSLRQSTDKEARSMAINIVAQL